MNSKKDRITFHGKGCDYEFSIPTDLGAGETNRDRFLNICKSEWDGLNDWAIGANIKSMKKYGILRGDEDGGE